MKVSIAMATYNGEKYLKEQLDSILAQSVQDFELIVCDDCSSDSTVQILNEYAKNDTRIKVFANEKNLGFKKNFEKAISLCSADFITLSDQDDVWTKNHLEILLNSIGKNDLIGGDAFICDSNANPIGLTMLSKLHIDFLPKTKEKWFFYLLHANIFQGAALLFRKKIIKDAFPIPDSVRFHDWWLALVACKNNGNGVNLLHEPILYYRQYGDNVTEDKNPSFWERVKDRLSKQKHLAAMKEMREWVDAVKNNLALSENEKAEAEAAIKYFNERKVLYRIGYFLKNYKNIFLSKSIRRFIARLGNLILTSLL